MAAVLWIALAVPAVAAVLVRLAPRGERTLAIAGAAGAALPAWLLLAGAADGERASSVVQWLPAAGLGAGLRLDPLSAAMSATVATVGVAVIVHSTGYLAGDPRRRSALAGLLGFLAAMQGLVLADGFLTLLVFWELVGAASARLIAYERDDPLAAPGAVRAFLTTRTADVGLYLAVLALFAAGSGLGFSGERPDGALGAVVALGIIVAAAGKSAQAPLQSWLMGAMAGPTPVSALLHSATMVAAGVYLLMRGHALLAGWPLEVVGWLGAVTAAASAAIALAQQDLKRVLAASTSSQLGLMFVGLAAGGPVVALFHLVTHAAGKACMFLAAGVFGRGRGTTRLGGLAGAGREDRVAFGCFAVGALSIAAVPPLAAFWSKEHVAAAAEHRPAWLLLVTVAAAGAAAYLLRPALVLCDRRGQGAGNPDVAGRGAMLAGTGALAAGCLVLGLVGGPLRDLVGGELPTSPASLALSLAAIAAGAAAVALQVGAPAWLRGTAARQFATQRVLDALARGPALALARGADRADRSLVDAVVDGLPRAAVLAAAGLSAADARAVDRVVDGVAHGTVGVAGASDVLERRGIDAAVDGLAGLVGRGGGRSGHLQTGRLHEYLRDTALGATAVAAIVALAAVL